MPAFIPRNVWEQVQLALLDEGIDPPKNCEVFNPVTGKADCPNRADWLMCSWCCETPGALCCDLHRGLIGSNPKVIDCRFCRKTGRIMEIVRFVPWPWLPADSAGAS
jgi:hypothetical protein